MVPNKDFSKKAREDFKLVDKALQTNDEYAYITLMQRYKRPVYFIILKMVRNVDDAEDLTMEAFAKAFENLHRYKKDYTFSTWLFRIATNNAIDFMRKKKLATLSLDTGHKDGEGESTSMNIKDNNLNPHEEVIKSQKIAFVREFVTKLPPKYQRLIKLRFFQERSYEEIASTLNIPLGTVKAQLYRAREFMYNLLKDRREYL